MTGDRPTLTPPCRRAGSPADRLPDPNRKDRRDSLARAEAVIAYLMARSSRPARERKFSVLDYISIIS